MKYTGRQKHGLALGIVLLVTGSLGCAKGSPAIGDVALLELNDASASEITDGVGMAGTAGMSGGDSGVPEPRFTGEACMQGMTMPCTCADGVSAGEKRCMYSADSPTMGALGECTRCVMPEPPPDAGTAGTGDAAGAAGTAGAEGSAGASAGMSGTGASGTGSAGMDGTAGSSGDTCDPDACPEPRGLFAGAACCTRDDQCGERTLLGGCQS